MKWPSTEVVVFGLIAAILLAGSVADAALGRFAKRDIHRAAGHHRLILLLSLIGLALLILTVAYFWFIDPASDDFRRWLDLRSPE